jgi:hypothetical protein
LGRADILRRNSEKSFERSRLRWPTRGRNGKLLRGGSNAVLSMLKFACAVTIIVIERYRAQVWESRMRSGAAGIASTSACWRDF